MNDANVSGSLCQDDAKIDADAGLSREIRHQRWQSKRPPIDHLRDALAVDADGTMLPLFDVGERIVVDRRTNFLKNTPWLETIVGKVRSIDDDTGRVTIFDEESDDRAPTVRYFSFLDGLTVFKFAPAKGNPFEPPPEPKQPRIQPQPGKRGRGRPKGSRNRPKTSDQ